MSSVSFDAASLGPYHQGMNTELNLQESALEDMQPHVFKPDDHPLLAAQALAATMPAVPLGSLAIISDVHANLEALTAVLAEISRRGIKRIICLGDVVGYGPNPLECIDIISERCEYSLMGNHDFAIFFEPYNFNTAAENAAYNHCRANPNHKQQARCKCIHRV